MALCRALRYRRENALVRRFRDKYPDRAAMANMTLEDAQIIAQPPIEWSFPLMYKLALQFAIFKVRGRHRRRLQLYAAGSSSSSSSSSSFSFSSSLTRHMPLEPCPSSSARQSRFPTRRRRPSGESLSVLLCCRGMGIERRAVCC